MATDPLSKTRNRLLQQTLDALEQLDPDDLAASFDKIAPALASARAEALSATVAHVITTARSSIAKRTGVELDWQLLDENEYAGPAVHRQYAARLAHTGDWLRTQQAAGRDPGELIEWLTYWQQQIAGSTVHETARRAGLAAGGNSPLHGRYMRIAEPKACRYCLAQASRGPVFVTSSTADAVSHGNCKCEIVLVENDTAIKHLRDEGAIAWQESSWARQWSAEQSQRQQAKRTAARTRQRTRAGVPVPRDTRTVADVIKVAKAGDVTPERLAAIDLQVWQYDQWLPELRRRAAAGEDVAKPLAWQEAQLARLQAERTSILRMFESQGHSERPNARIESAQRQAAGPASRLRGDRFVLSQDEAGASRLLDEYTAGLGIQPSKKTWRGINEYQDGGHSLLNRVLWQAPGSYGRLTGPEMGRVSGMRSSLDWLTSVSESPGITVWRGIPNGYGLDHSRLQPGDTLPPRKGFTSTSIARNVAESFLKGGSSSVLFELNVPKGRRGAWLPAFSTKAWVWQQEFLLPRECRILVTEVSSNDGLTIVKGEVL